jgi:DNA-binding response OmpR family regulator
LNTFQDNATKASILVVDDTPDNLRLLAGILGQQGYEVRPMPNGQLALMAAQSALPDLILLDINMPELNGYEVCERLKADEKTRDIPVIFISARGEVDDKVTAFELGGVDYVTKPFQFEEVLARVRTHLALRDLQKQLERTNEELEELNDLLQEKLDIQVRLYRQLDKEKKRADDLLNVVIPIGVALSAEQEFDRLLERIVLEAKSFCYADGGTLYLRTEDDHLKFVIMRNDSLNIALGGISGKGISFPPLPLYDETTGEPNNRSVATHAALSGVSINIADAYEAERPDLSGIREFDQGTNYRTRSCLTIPLKNRLDQVLGVLQLINAQDPETDQVIPFDSNLQQMMESLSSLAVVALEAYIREQRLRQQIEQLRIEIDKVQRQEQVSEIVETDFFQDLKSKACSMRLRHAKRDAPGDKTP